MSFYMRKKYFLFLTDFIGIKTDSDSLYVSYVTPVMSHVTPVMSHMRLSVMCLIKHLLNPFSTLQ